jgi:hypothetical protein
MGVRLWRGANGPGDTDAQRGRVGLEQLGLVAVVRRGGGGGVGHGLLLHWKWGSSWVRRPGSIGLRGGGGSRSRAHRRRPEVCGAYRCLETWVRAQPARPRAPPRSEGRRGAMLASM